MADILVTTLIDENDGATGGKSLREALAEAGPNDTIIFDSNMLTGGKGEIDLTIGELLIDESITINGDVDGDGIGDITIDAQGNSRVFNINDNDSDTAQTVVLSGLTITGGTIAGFGNNGGGIFNAEDLTLANSTVSGNSATKGGGISNLMGTMTLTNSTVSANIATSGNGGGILNDGAFSFPPAAQMTLTNSTVSGNFATGGSGGGIANYNATATLTNSTVTDNFAGSSGGGIYESGIRALTVNLINSLISGNTATTGAEIYNYGTVNANGNNLLGHSGLTESEAFGGFNPINFGTSDIVATSDKTSSATHTPTALTDILNTTLADNGGPTQTHALVADSPAIDAGDNTKLGGITTDQRGENRVVDGDLNMVATVDIGAFEECFLTGTRILTDQGEVPVEELKIGDRVQTTDGSFQPIKWVGHQTREPGQIRNPLRGYPIQIKTGALGNGLPHRDLFVSPDHALLFGGLLINAGALVNGTSICKTTPTETFVYHHIELAQHSLLVAEGTAAESYLPQKEDRPAYDNGDEYLELYPHNDILCYWPLKYPRISSMRQMPRSIRKQLAQIAQTLDSTTAGVA